MAVTDLMDISLRKLWEVVEDREAWRVVVHGVQRVTENNNRFSGEELLRKKKVGARQTSPETVT